jgi:peptide/nickel transport system ATP-binding protein
MNRPLLSVENLRVGFDRDKDTPLAVDDVSFEIQPGTAFALVGESGSGKSVTALSVLRLLPPSARVLGGKALLDGDDVFGVSEYAMCRIRGRRIGIIFQDPMTSLNPVVTIGHQLDEILKRHGRRSERTLAARKQELLRRVGLPEPERRMNEYPHQLSGGMRQRVMIAIALAGDPELLIADEPTTALDVTIQAQILNLLKTLQRENGMALWLITHDLGIVAEMADQVAVMRKGQIVERASRERFFAQPEHPYSQQLFAALPSMDHCRQRQVARETAPPLLEVRDFKVYYPIHAGLFHRVVSYVRAVDGVSFSVARGQTLALVGESGCGKTTLGKGILKLIPGSGGEVVFRGSGSEDAGRAALRTQYAGMQIIFQDPFSSMNPRMLVGDIIEEGLRALRPEMPTTERRDRAADLLARVGLPKASRLRYPHEFSGGQRQRICIARALAVSPKLIVCDEPTSSLDVSVQAQIIDLLKELQAAEGISYLFISHNLAIVAELADEVAVMYGGRIVELGAAERVLRHPAHPYTAKLLAAVPKVKHGLRQASKRDPAVLPRPRP